MEVIKVIKIIKLFFFLNFIIIIFCLTSCYSNKQVEEYLTSYDRCLGVAVTDYTNVICIDNQVINVKELFNSKFESLNLQLNRIIYFSNNELYVVGKNSYEKEFHLIIVDILFESYENVFSFKSENKVIKMEMLDENVFFYSFLEKSYIYLLDNKEVKEVSNDYDNYYLVNKSKYKFEKEINSFSSNTTKYIIESRNTNEVKTLKKEDFLTIEQAKFLNEKRIFDLSDIYEVDEKVFIIAKSKFHSIIFKYNFELDKLEYYSWISTKNLISDFRFYYFQ